jgi:GST-like protein
MKVALLLEEAGLAYEMFPVDTRRGQQHAPEFLAINPNAKTPAIVDTDGGVRVFDSNAILLYLAEKTGRFLGSPAQRGELLSWLMLVATGLGPYNGQAVHFQHHAPDKSAYAIKRYRYEAKRHFELFDQQLAGRPFVLGDDYTIVDMALWGWTNPIGFVLGDGAIDRYPELKRWHASISGRPAAQRANALRAGFDTPFDDEARKALFPQIDAPAEAA